MHESSKTHSETFGKWKSLEITSSSLATIDKLEQHVVKKGEKHGREILSRLLDIIRFLAMQNLAFRGHREYDGDLSDLNQGNFLELVHLVARYDALLSKHLMKLKIGSQKLAVCHLSPRVKNEFIYVLGD